MPVIDGDPDEFRDRLAAADITIEPGNTDHEHWRATHGDATAVAYDEKLVVQGKRPTDITAHLTDATGHVDLYFDGASRGNPGPAAIGWVLATDDGIVAETGETIGHKTNNQAEYEALLHGLRAAAKHGFDTIAIHGDSKLVVEQLRGAWDTNDPTLQEHRVTALELLQDFDDWTATHVPREMNDRADDLANDALDDA